jgi:uncharacterized membrane protein YkvA (DUF1232 family)
MNQQSPRQSMPNGWNWTTILRDLVATWRLLWDPSVPGLLKFALPFLALLYWISPLDLIPMVPFDDIAVVLLAARLFVALAPRDSVDRAFGGNRATPPPASHQAPPRQESGEVIETTWRVIKD